VKELIASYLWLLLAYKLSFKINAFGDFLLFNTYRQPFVIDLRDVKNFSFNIIKICLLLE